MPLTLHAIKIYNEAVREQIMEGEGFEGEVYYNYWRSKDSGDGTATFSYNYITFKDYSEIK